MYAECGMLRMWAGQWRLVVLRVLSPVDMQSRLQYNMGNMGNVET